MQVMRRDVLALLAALLIFPLLASAADPPNNPPNVVLITIDTVRADHVGCYGYKLIETPHLDAWPRPGFALQTLILLFPSRSRRTA